MTINPISNTGIYNYECQQDKPSKDEKIKNLGKRLVTLFNQQFDHPELHYILAEFKERCDDYVDHDKPNDDEIRDLLSNIFGDVIDFVLDLRNGASHPDQYEQGLEILVYIGASYDEILEDFPNDEALAFLRARPSLKALRILQLLCEGISTDENKQALEEMQSMALKEVAGCPSLIHVISSGTMLASEILCVARICQKHGLLPVFEEVVLQLRKLDSKIMIGVIDILERAADNQELEGYFPTLLQLTRKILREFASNKFDNIRYFTNVEYFEEILIPLVKQFNQQLIGAPDEKQGELFASFDFLFLSQVKGKSHLYDDNAFNACVDTDVSVWEYLKIGKLTQHYLFCPNQTLDDLQRKLNKLKILVLACQKNVNNMHAEANTLKCLTYFLPKGNPDFKIYTERTFDIVLEIILHASTHEDLRKGLLFLDIFHPELALRLYYFYLTHKGRLSLSKETYKALSPQEQINYVEYFRHMRIRNAEVARYILKHQADRHELSIAALQWLSAVKQELKPRLRAFVTTIMQYHSSLELRMMAAQTLWTTHSNTKDVATRNLLYVQLCQCNINIPDQHVYIKTLLQTLSHYEFNEARDEPMLRVLSSMELPNTELAIAWVFAMMRIVAKGQAMVRSTFPNIFLFDFILIRCKNIVEAETWESWDTDFLKDFTIDTFIDDIEIAHFKYPTFQTFEHNRHRILVGILDLFVTLYPNIPTPPEELEQYENDYYYNTPMDVYYIPLVHLAPNAKAFRAIGTRRGSVVCQQAVLEALSMGCFSRSLDYAQHDSGNWSKRRDDLTASFFTPVLELAMHPLYYDVKDGAMIAVDASKINRERQSLNTRYERESGQLNIAVFGGISRHEYEYIFLHESWRDDLELIAGRSTMSADLKRLVEMDDAFTGTAEEKKQLKRAMRIEVSKIQTLLMNHASKQILKTLTIKEILELHRHLNKANFIDTRVVFGKSPASCDLLKNPGENGTPQATTSQLAKMSQFKSLFKNSFGHPFCLGQHEILALPPQDFVLKIATLISSLKAFDARCGLPFDNSYHESRLISLSRFNQECTPLSLPAYYLKIFRLAIFFKDYPLAILRKMLVNPEYLHFFGFGHYQVESAQAVCDLVSLYHLHRSPEPKTPEVLGNQFLRTRRLLKLATGPQTNQLTAAMHHFLKAVL